MAYRNIDQKCWPIIDEWLRRLESGEYTQDLFTLRRVVNGEISNCAVGVLGEVLVDLDSDYFWDPNWGGESFTITHKDTYPNQTTYGAIFRKIITASQYNTVIHWNDEVRLSFPVIVRRFKKDYFYEEEED